MDQNHYLRLDIRSLMQGTPALRLSNRGLPALLREAVAAGRAYGKFLGEYPVVMCEPLELFYQSRRSVDALDSALLRDLLLESTWREANWGAWLAVLAPNPEHRELLELRKDSLPYGRDILDLALASLGDAIRPELTEQLALVNELRGMFDRMPARVRLLRVSPTGLELAQYKAEAHILRLTYAHAGVTAAARLTKQGLLAYYGQDSKVWLAAGESEN